MSQVALPGSSTTTSPGTSRCEETALHAHPFLLAVCTGNIVMLPVRARQGSTTSQVGWPSSNTPASPNPRLCDHIPGYRPHKCLFYVHMYYTSTVSRLPLPSTTTTKSQSTNVKQKHCATHCICNHRGHTAKHGSEQARQPSPLCGVACCCVVAFEQKVNILSAATVGMDI